MRYVDTGQVSPQPPGGSPMMQHPGMGAVPATSSLVGWPLRSDAFGGTTRQIQQLIDRNKKHGISQSEVDYDPKDGTAIIHSREARKKLTKVEGFKDRSAGYGDYNGR